MSMILDDDVMVDLETLGVAAGCPILTIGACNIRGDIKFYGKISLASCLDAGLVADSDTIAWWDRQSDEAKAAAFCGTDSLYKVLMEFYAWYLGMAGKGIWGNGATFDVPILEAAYKAIKLTPPWTFREHRCYRTIKSIYPRAEKSIAFEGIMHDALADAVHQAKVLKFIAHNYMREDM